MTTTYSSDRRAGGLVAVEGHAIAKAYAGSHDRQTWQGAGSRTYVADERSPPHKFSDNNQQVFLRS